MTRKPINKLYANIKPTAKLTVEIQGKGPQGKEGKSAYQTWLELGNTGTEEDFINSLKASEADYNALENKPSINDVLMVGNITFEELGIEVVSKEEIEALFE